MDFVIYTGKAFTIEWYFDQKGYSEALEYYQKLPVERRVKLMKLVKLIGEVGRIYDVNKFRNEGDKIFTFKPKPDRFLCFFFSGRKIVVTNAFEKKSQKLPRHEKERALSAKADYEWRVKRGEYYEEG